MQGGAPGTEPKADSCEIDVVLLIWKQNRQQRHNRYDNSRPFIFKMNEQYIHTLVVDTVQGYPGNFREAFSKNHTMHQSHIAQCTIWNRTLYQQQGRSVVGVDVEAQSNIQPQHCPKGIFLLGTTFAIFNIMGVVLIWRNGLKSAGFRVLYLRRSLACLSLTYKTLCL